MAEHVGFSRAWSLVAAGLVGALALVGLPAAGAAPSGPPTTAPNPAPSGPTTTVPPRPIAVDRSHPVFAPDGCPTTPPAHTLRGLAVTTHLSLYQICLDSVRTARSPAAALAIRFALSELGTPYSQPLRNRPHIYDCSSFVARAYQAAGVPIAYPDTPGRIDGGPHQNTPTTRDEVVAPWAIPVTPLTAKPGDLVFFPGADPPNGHVGMLLADGLLVHTNATGDVAHVDTLKVAAASAWRAVDPTKVPAPATPDIAARALAVQDARPGYETAAGALAGIRHQLAAAQAERAQAVDDLQAARDQHTEAARQEDLARRHLRDVGVLAYMQGGDTSGLTMGLGPSSVVDASRTQTYLGAVGNRMDEAAKAYKQARDTAVKEERDRQARLDALDAQIHNLQLDATRAQAALAAALSDPSSPILGPSQLGAAELVAWYRSTGQHEQTSVPIEVLAQLFITEGDRAGVRGDVAFAEAALDTGGFTFPAAGALSGHDNGLSLIGGCDTCQGIPWFTSAEQAVRAQIQVLRTYADVAATPASFGTPPVVPGVLGVETKGTIKGWNQLPGMALPAPEYGTAIVNLYGAIATWVTAHPVPEPKPTPGSHAVAR